MIIIVLLLLAICTSIDYADNNDTITNIDENATIEFDENITVVNGTYILPKDAGKAISDGKIYTDKKVEKKHKKRKLPTITITSRPSCGCGYGYYWHTMRFVNYCPHCHKYGTLRNVHKWPARYEQELTCDPRLGGCGCDYCGCCGKEKMSYSKYYLKTT